jgi:Mrp family chromosome partitioning ATPase
MNEAIDATTAFAPIWRLKWLILAVGLVVAVATYAYYKTEATVFSSTAQLFVGGAEEGGVVNGLLPTKRAVSGRAIASQAALINSGVVGQAAMRELRREHPGHAPVGKAHATTTEGSNFVTIDAESSSGAAASEVANAYAQAYIALQAATHREQIMGAIARTRQEIHKVEAGNADLFHEHGSRHSSVPATIAYVTFELSALGNRLSQYESEIPLVGVEQVGKAGPKVARLIGPTPRRDAVFGFLIGVALASLAAYLLGVFDPRMRSLSEIEAAFGARILTGLPDIAEPIAREGGQPVPAEPLLEPLRRLYTALRVRTPGTVLPAFVEGSDGAAADQESGDPSAPWGKLFERSGSPGAVGAAPRSVLFVSADSGDGKSTLVANLAVVARDSGESVAIVEADLRRPAQATLLGENPPHGLVDVLAGQLSLEAAMPFVGPAPRSAAPAAVAWGGDGEGGGVATAVLPSVAALTGGYLRVLTAGAAVSNPPALLASARMAELLQVVAEEHEFTLVDGPPPLAVSDAIPLLRLVDGIVVVVRFGNTRNAAAARLMELVHTSSGAPVLGVVATGVPLGELRRHGLWSPYYKRSDWLNRLFGS